MHHALHSSALWQTVLVVTVSKAIRVMSRWPIGPWVVGAQPSWLGAPPPPCFGRWRRDPPNGGVSINHLGYLAYICTPLCTSINQSIHSLQSTLLTVTMSPTFYYYNHGLELWAVEISAEV